VTKHIERDLPTLSSYGFVGVWAFFLYFVGPATPIIADQLQIEDALAALTGTALAGGLVGSGFVGPKLIGRIGRRRATRLVLMVMIVSALALAAAPGLPAMLLAVLVCALAGAILANMASAVLAERHGDLGSTALTEANAVAAWIGLFAPAAIGVVVSIGWGWRPAAVGIAGIAGIMLIRTTTMSRADFQETASADSAQAEPVAREPEPELSGSAALDASPDTGLGRTFYLALLTVVSAVATEFSLNFWGAVLLVERIGIDLAVATASISVLIGGVALGRTLGSRVTYYLHPRQILLAGFGLAFLAFVLLMWSQTLWVSLVALLLTGIGLAMLFPLAQSLAINASKGRTDAATGYVSMSVGISIGVAPFVLGALVSLVGVIWAFVVVPIAIGAGVVSVLLAPGQDPKVRAGESVSI
jgi:MFS family permease